MATVTKLILTGASFYGRTIACGQLEFIKKYGFMCCGSGDDHKLSKKEKVLVRAHDANNGDLELESGKL